MDESKCELEEVFIAFKQARNALTNWLYLADLAEAQARLDCF